MSVETEDAAARARWLDALFDLDVPARAAALASQDVPLEWRATGERLCALADKSGILDHDPRSITDSLFEAAQPAPEPGASAGRYRLERLIGEGGMATVWLARHQDERLPQQVAVKCLRTTLSTPEWRERFLREQRILARLRHPNVTRLYDAGITETGTPYIVMEYVAGEPITEYCDRLALPCKERIALFLKVCASVAHAHRSLIVHRDLKPRNVLVSEDGEPHLLDFGIAKLLDRTDADAQMTRTGLLLLTPAYAAPEQFAHGTITTTTDVYGLGAMLHELLTGARARHHGDGRLQLPSGRVTAEAARLRGAISPAILRRQLRGDLDAILERALRHEPELRYGSVVEFGEDLERWLAGKPVAARAGSWRYRANKFVRRHWIVLGLVTMAIGVLSVTTFVSLRESERADLSAQLARRAAERATHARDFVIEMMQDMRSGGAMDAPQILERAAQLARDRFRDDPETHATLLTTIGELDRGYGQLKASRRLLEEASAIAHQHQGAASALRLEAEAHLGHTAFREGTDVVAMPRLAEALRDYDAAGGVDGPARVRAQIILGQLLGHVGQRDEALSLLREAGDSVSRVTDPSHPLRQMHLETYGSALAESGRYAEARRVLTDNVALARARYGNEDLGVVSALESLAVCEISAGQPEAALPHLYEAKRMARDLLDRPHVMAAYVENTLGTALIHLGRSAEAEVAFDRALRLHSALYPAPHRMLVATHSNLGEAAIEQARFDDAAAAFEEAARQRRELRESTIFGGIDPACLAGEAHARGSSPAAGIAALKGCIADLQQEAAPEAAYLASAHGALALARLRSADRANAGINASEALSHSPASLSARLVLAQLAHEQGDRNAALAQGRAALEAPWLSSRPCDVRRQLHALATRMAEVGDPTLAQTLSQRADRISCASVPTRN